MRKKIIGIFFCLLLEVYGTMCFLTGNCLYLPEMVAEYSRQLFV